MVQNQERCHFGGKMVPMMMMMMMLWWWWWWCRAYDRRGCVWVRSSERAPWLVDQGEVRNKDQKNECSVNASQQKRIKTIRTVFVGAAALAFVASRWEWLRSPELLRRQSCYQGRNDHRHSRSRHQCPSWLRPRETKGNFDAKICVGQGITAVNCKNDRAERGVFRKPIILWGQKVDPSLCQRAGFEDFVSKIDQELRCRASHLLSFIQN